MHRKFSLIYGYHACLLACFHIINTSPAHNYKTYIFMIILVYNAVFPLDTGYSGVLIVPYMGPFSGFLLYPYFALSSTQKFDCQEIMKRSNFT